MSDKEKAVRKSSKRAVIVYSAILFAVVLFFIGLSYFIDRRGDHTIDALHVENSSAMERIEALQTENVDLRAENEDLKQRLDALELELDRMKTKYEDLWLEHGVLQNNYNELLEYGAASTEETEND
ncbi:MAG: hypothetical protein LBN00_01935 [Oscillospiraceae bacterium]|nr:hypothetical protein [Oscillospiraceae bacterium]